MPGLATHFNHGFSLQSWQGPYTDWMGFGARVLRQSLQLPPPIPEWHTVVRSLGM